VPQAEEGDRTRRERTWMRPRRQGRGDVQGREGKDMEWKAGE